jgi:hypothetical protein
VPPNEIVPRRGPPLVDYEASDIKSQPEAHALKPSTYLDKRGANSLKYIFMFLRHFTTC